MEGQPTSEDYQRWTFEEVQRLRVFVQRVVLVAAVVVGLVVVLAFVASYQQLRELPDRADVPPPLPTTITR